MATAPVAFAGKVYSPRKQLVWNQCQEYLRRDTMFFLQIDNLTAGTKVDLKQKLHKVGISLKNPKPAILRKALRKSGLAPLEGAIAGPTFVALANRKPHQLRDALSFIATQRNITLLAGKVGRYPMTVEGIRDLVFGYQSRASLCAEVAGLLQAPASQLASGLNGAASGLASLLDRNCQEMDKASAKEK